jgi:hypothetical protein
MSNMESVKVHISFFPTYEFDKNNNMLTGNIVVGKCSSKIREDIYSMIKNISGLDNYFKIEDDKIVLQ